MFKVMKSLKRPDILQVLEDYGIETKRVGNTVFACCLWHSDSNPSMAIYPDTNSYYCFVCKAHGTVENLIAKIQHKSYYQVVNEIYGDKYEFRKLGEVTKPLDPDVKFMRESLATELRRALQSHKFNVDNVPNILNRMVSTKMTLHNYKLLLEEIRNGR